MQALVSLGYQCAARVLDAGSFGTAQVCAHRAHTSLVHLYSSCRPACVAVPPPLIPVICHGSQPVSPFLAHAAPPPRDRIRCQAWPATPPPPRAHARIRGRGRLHRKRHLLCRGGFSRRDRGTTCCAHDEVPLGRYRRWTPAWVVQHATTCSGTPILLAHPPDLCMIQPLNFHLKTHLLLVSRHEWSWPTAASRPAGGRLWCSLCLRRCRL